ncbi:MAG: SET domain-containing protein [Hydrococcus sp. RM1_1_31]|nr:SET domain-containing protein [Hydrococcus sp. RM1_1_31]
MLAVETNTKSGIRLVTTSSIKKGTVFHKLTDYQIVPDPTYQTVQLDEQNHFDELNVLALLNHSCEPNVIVDTTLRECRAIRDIMVGEELNFFYPSTEWDMARPFQCQCGSPRCIKFVAGASYVSDETLSQYFVNQHILGMKRQCSSEKI